jgi:N-acetylmuramoyl-L-alanine amidase
MKPGFFHCGNPVSRLLLGMMITIMLLSASSIQQADGRRPSPTLLSSGYEITPELTRVYINTNQADIRYKPVPRITGNEIHIYFKNFRVEKNGSLTRVSRDNIVQSVRIRSWNNGGLVVVKCHPGVLAGRVKPKLVYAAEKSFYFLEIQRPAKMQPSPQVTQAQLAEFKKNNVKVVILDPGHGGRDPGTKGNGLKEKDEVLKLCLEMQKAINTYGKDKNGKTRIRAFLTRRPCKPESRTGNLVVTGDYNLGSLRKDRLSNRIKRAVDMEGDLFLSVHLNYSRYRSASGWEIHVARSTRTTINADMKENPDNLHEYMIIENGDQKSNAVNGLIHGLVKQLMFEQSGEWADTLGRRMKNLKELRARGRKETNKFVCGSLAMPSVLLEVAFVSNRNDARIVRDKRFRSRLQASVFNAVVDYFSVSDASLKQLAKALPAKSRTQVASAKYRRYKIRKGDTIEKIARKYKTSSKTIMRANGLNARTARKIRPGKTLKIPY